MKAKVIEQAIIADRLERQNNDKPASVSRPKVEGSDFDPFAYTRWRVVAGGDPGYLPKTPMRRAATGWFVECRCCAREFESKGLAYCPKCMDESPEVRRARRANRKVAQSPPKSPSSLPQAGTLEILGKSEVFLPAFGPTDFPSILVGPGKRGVAFQVGQLAEVLDAELGPTTRWPRRLWRKEAA
jgi:hypothetical protein